MDIAKEVREMNREFCIRCIKQTECVLVSKVPNDPFKQQTLQCLECGCTMGSMTFPPGSTIEFGPPGAWGPAERKP